MFRGRCWEAIKLQLEIRTCRFGVSLVPGTQKDRGLRPIVLANKYTRSALKLRLSIMIARMGYLLAPPFLERTVLMPMGERGMKLTLLMVRFLVQTFPSVPCLQRLAPEE